MRTVYSRDNDMVLGTVEDGVFSTTINTFDKDTVTRLRDMHVRTIHYKDTNISLADAVRNGKIRDRKWVVTLYDQVDIENSGGETNGN